MPLKFRNIFSGSSKPVERPIYYPEAYSENHHPRPPSPATHIPLHHMRPTSMNQLVPTDHNSRGATVTDYVDDDDASSFMSDMVLVPGAEQIPTIHRQYSRDHLNHPPFEHDDYHHHAEHVPMRPRSERTSSSGSTSTRSSNRSSSDRSGSDRSSSDPDELPPRIIPEYSRRHSEYRSEYATGTPHTRAPTELPYGPTEAGTTRGASTSRSRSRPRERRRRKRSDSRKKPAPIILMFENGRGGYENLWYITPGEAPVVFQDAEGNEITRVGDFSHVSVSAPPQAPIFLDRFGRARNRDSIYPHAIRSESDRGMSEHEDSGLRYHDTKRPMSPSGSVTFMNLSKDGPQSNYVDPHHPHSPNVIYVDHRGRSPPHSKHTSTHSPSIHPPSVISNRSYGTAPSESYAEHVS